MSRRSDIDTFTIKSLKDHLQIICDKKVYERNYEQLLHHQSFKPPMRAELLKWLLEICEEFNFTRETYHLAVDFVDRYIAIESNLTKENFQITGNISIMLSHIKTNFSVARNHMSIYCC